MKYILGIIVGFFLSTQIKAAPALSVEAGFGTTLITGSDALVTSSAMRLGPCLRVSFEQSFSDRFTLRTGVALETRGEKNNSFQRLEGYSEETVEELDILNLQIPILAQVNFPFKKFCINLFGGPELGVFLNGKSRSEVTSTFDADETTPARSAIAYDTTDFSRKMKMLDGGLRVGVGFELNTGSFGAFIARPSAYIGLVDILQTGHEMKSLANLIGEHQAFSFSLGYKFNIRQKLSNASAYKSSERSSTTSKTATETKSTNESNLDGYRNYDSDSSQEGSSNSGSGYDSTGDE